ncbi:efflux RND transporter permease subunit, partial [Acinetobacter baumannii]
AKDGALIRMRDVASVDLGAQSNDSSVSMNGEHAVFIAIQPTPSGNPLTIVQAVRKLMPDLQRSLPASVTMGVAYDSSR